MDLTMSDYTGRHGVELAIHEMPSIKNPTEHAVCLTVFDARDRKSCWQRYTPIAEVPKALRDNYMGCKSTEKEDVVRRVELMTRVFLAALDVALEVDGEKMGGA